MARNLFSIGSRFKRRNGIKTPGAPVDKGEYLPMGGGGKPAFSGGAAYAQTTDRPAETPSGAYSYQQAAQGGANDKGAAQNGAGSSFDEYYNKLIKTLQSYGISMTLPSLDEIRAQLTAFLRPSVDAAIENRKSYGDTVMAELDADAYSRGMGGSSYLSSMKKREYDGIGRDISAMETNYASTMAQYLYNASNELQSIQAKFAQMALENAYEEKRLKQQREFEMQKLYAQQAHDEKMRLLAMQAKPSYTGSGGSGGSSGGGKSGKGGNSGEGGAVNNGKGFTEEQYQNNYTGYSVYLKSLSESERYNVFNSGEAKWAELREELMRNLTPELYQKLKTAFNPKSGGSGKGPGSAPKYTNMFN